MPICFQLLDKVTNDPVSLNQVDNRICREVFNTNPHSQWYGAGLFNWFDTIGFRIASGSNLSDVREYYNSSDMWKEDLELINPVIDFLEENYNARSFYSINRF